MAEWLFENASLLSSGLTMCAFAVVHRSEIMKRIPDMIIAGALGGAFPAGVILVWSAFNPELTDQLRNFPGQLLASGFVYIVFAVWGLVKIFKK